MASAAITKAVLRGEFPLTAQFRSGPRNYKPSYDQWEEQQPRFDGFPVDLQTNVLRFEPRNYKFANRYAEENPETLVLSTWRAASGTPKGSDDDGDPLGISPISYPGHFVYSPGAYLDSNISPSSTTLSVMSGANMVKGPAVLVETANSGRKKLWQHFEYVKITAVSGTRISVQREFNGSPPARSFSEGSTYIAPMPWDTRNRIKYVDWFFNFSEDCPKDENGKTAMDVIFEEMLYPLKEGGPLENIGGLDFASGPLTVIPENADYDMDGHADPESVYHDAVKTFYEGVRKILGPDRVLTTSFDYNYLDYINGLNLEGLARPDDAWVEVARTVNRVLAWKRVAKLPMISLAFVQYVKNVDQPLIVQLHRLLNGYATCLGLAADADDSDLADGLNELTRIELFKGDEKQAHWLGRSIGMKRPAAMTDNLLGGAKDDTDWDAIMSAISVGKRADMFVDNGELVIRPNGYGSGYVTLELYFELSQRSDITVFFEAKSDDNQVERDILLPRVYGVDYETGPTRAEISGLDYFPLSFYVRRASRGSVTMDFRFADGGDVRIKSLGVHAAPDALACEFERGVVLVNPSLDDASLDLTEIFPDRRGFRRLSASKPGGEVPDMYRKQLAQALDMNNGQTIRDPTSVQVGQRNALFLATTDVATAGSQRGPMGSDNPPHPVEMPPPHHCDENRPCENPHHCCSQYGWCDVGEKYCGRGCQNGPCWEDKCHSADGCEVPSSNGDPAGSNNEQEPEDESEPRNVFRNEEDTEFKYKGKMLSCRWAGFRPGRRKRRCRKKTSTGLLVKEYCPKTCRALGNAAQG